MRFKKIHFNHIFKLTKKEFVVFGNWSDKSKIIVSLCSFPSIWFRIYSTFYPNLFFISLNIIWFPFPLLTSSLPTVPFSVLLYITHSIFSSSTVWWTWKIKYKIALMDNIVLVKAYGAFLKRISIFFCKVIQLYIRQLCK